MVYPLISIIIPTYNRASFLLEALNSLLEQSYGTWECLIIDDGSDGEEFAVVENFIARDNRFSLYKRPLDLRKGPSACRNFGVSKAKGEYIQFFDDDDLMYSHMLECKLEVLKKTGADVVVAPLELYLTDSEKVHSQNKVYSPNLIEDYIVGNITWYSSGPMWRKTFLREGFDEGIQTLDDYDFNLRMIYRNPYVEYLAEPLQRYNKYGIGETLSSRAQKGDENQISSGFKAYKKHYLLLEKQGMLTKSIRIWFINRFVFLLRAALLGRYKVSQDIFSFFRKKIDLGDMPEFLWVYLGYYSYKYLNKGYRFFIVEE